MYNDISKTKSKATVFLEYSQEALDLTRIDVTIQLPEKSVG